MKLIIKNVIDKEICHYASPDMVITSFFNTVFVKQLNKEFSIELPQSLFKNIFSCSRLLRRALRLDKCNVVPVGGGFIIIRGGKVFHYDETLNKLEHVLTLNNCRNVLHQSVAVINNKEIFFGEYSSNRLRKSVNVYRSLDAGKNWETVFTFPAGKIKHVHGCYYDSIEDKIWTLTGDYDGECHILCSDKDFNSIEYIGNGNQVYRACNVFFNRDSVHWIMDSQLQDCYHIKLDRKSRAIEQKQVFAGPVWYIKRLQDGVYLAATAQEIGPSLKDKYVHLMVSKDLETWDDIYQFHHDRLPKRYFKFGVLGFADGYQTSNEFYMFAEAISGLDGKIAVCQLEND